MTMTETEIRARAQKFNATIGWRNAREYMAAGFVVLFFGYFAVTDPNPVKQIGAAAIVVAAMFVSWVLYAQMSPAGDTGTAVSWYDRHRAELVRQRDALRAVWRWYAAPFVPGLLLMMAARHIYPEFRLDEPAALVAMLGPIAFLGIVFGAVIWLNLWAAGKVQRDIEELDLMNRPSELEHRD
jgi:hypothetical protein